MRLQRFYHILLDSSQSRWIGGLAGRASTEGSDPQFCQEVVGAVSSYKTDLLGFQTFLGETDKGLGNYDPSNELETAIKEMVNSVKESLKWIDALAYSIPGVGPELGERKWGGD